jgi:hypothetical protein
LRSQKKETKEKATPSGLFPVLLIFMGGNRKLAIAQTADHRIPHKTCAARRWTKGTLKPKEFDTF